MGTSSPRRTHTCDRTDGATVAHVVRRNASLARVQLAYTRTQQEVDAVAATRKIQYNPDTPAEAESEKYTRAVPRTRGNVRADRPSNGSVANPVKGRKLGGGANISGGSV